VRCIDVAALFAASVVRKNRQARVVPFEQTVVDVRLNPRDSVMTNAEKLARIGGGGTNCSAPLALLNRQKATGDMVIFVSDNESWADPQSGRGTELMRQWSAFKKRCPNAKLVCIDIQPNRSTQAREQMDILNVGGFSDRVFDIVAAFARNELSPNHWVGEVEKVRLDQRVA
jgi:60 kDa SS-A/Ro ribonucleoprotein